METSVDLSHYFSLVKNKMHYLLIGLFIGVGLAAVYTYFIVTPKYSSTTQMIAQSEQSSVMKSQINELNDLNTNILLVNTYKDILQSNRVLDETQKRLAKKGVKMQASAIKQMLSIKQSQNSQMFEVNVLSPNPSLSQVVGLELCEVFQEQSGNYTTIERVSIVSDASFSKTPVSPNNKLNLLVGVVLGLMTGLGMIFLFELLDQTIKDTEFVIGQGNIQILGTLTEVSEPIIEESKRINFGDYRRMPTLFYQDFQFGRRRRRKSREKECKRRK